MYKYIKRDDPASFTRSFNASHSMVLVSIHDFRKLFVASLLLLFLLLLLLLLLTSLTPIDSPRGGLCRGESRRRRQFHGERRPPLTETPSGGAARGRLHWGRLRRGRAAEWASMGVIDGRLLLHLLLLHIIQVYWILTCFDK